MKISVVLNGAAGSLVGQPIEESVSEVKRLFEEAGHTATVTAASGPEIVAAIDRAVASDAEVVVVGGGDGTVATAAGKLMGTDKALGILPLGTLNLYAKDLGIPLDIAEAVPLLAHGRIKPMDVGDVNGTVFLNHSVLGLYPMMVQEREEVREERGLSKWPAMAIAMCKALKRYPLLRVRLETDKGTRRITTPILAVANNPYDEGFGSFLKRSRLDTGELALYVAKHRQPLRMARMMVALVLGTWQRDAELEVMHMTEFTVKSRRRTLKVANDGEVHRMEAPLHYRMLAGGLRMLVPSEESGVQAASPGERLAEEAEITRAETARKESA
ncbi:diacylglycerol kinase family lipid kinase [Skermanella rosea]|uniref:diacylglycerol/lipid kinase family protein n=1 Tax=Skermanella rosea TaxID=1817965 RepID=UPI0019343E67|nr:diacylglycerol kinase family protein [Skermanella rosea]UEM04103.1 diacylglycerol kinase family lipid kinase [Skermanella rosea]